LPRLDERSRPVVSRVQVPTDIVFPVVFGDYTISSNCAIWPRCS
jgi:hypothetical protein